MSDDEKIKCPDCNGTKQFMGTLSMENCHRCDGEGVTDLKYKLAGDGCLGHLDHIPVYYSRLQAERDGFHPIKVYQPTVPGWTHVVREISAHNKDENNQKAVAIMEGKVLVGFMRFLKEKKPHLDFPNSNRTHVQGD